MKEPATPHPFTILALVATLLVGLTAGAYWHEPVASWLGRNATSPTATPVPAPAGPAQPKQLWTCSMHPQVIRDAPGLCPICHMELTPLRAAAASSDSTIAIDPAVIQNMGVRTAPVTRGPLHRTVRAVGYLSEPESARLDINLRVSGWIERLYADTEGMEIRKGAPLFDLYSPELQTAIEELIAARRGSASAHQATEPAGGVGAALQVAAERKLLLLGLSREQIAGLRSLDQAPRTVTFSSPISGHVTDKADLYSGSAVKAGDRVMRLADNSTMWLEIRVFEHDLPSVRVGQTVTALVGGDPRNSRTGQIAFIHPHLDPATRTAMVRVVLPNSMDNELRQGMFASARIRLDAPDALQVPAESVIDTGERQLAFIAQPGGRFQPRLVRTGLASDDGTVEILSGLSAGETVVTSGQFLLDSESRLREAVQKFLAADTPGAVSPALPNSIEGSLARLPVRPADQPKLDAVFRAYLDLAAALGAPQQADTPIDPQPLISAARFLHAAADGAPLDAPAAAVARSADSLRGLSLKDQRDRFKTLSTATIALADLAPPSRHVAEKLYIAHCPMVNADWLQTSPDIANPYYAITMKDCGEVTRTIDAPPAPEAPHTTPAEPKR